MLALLALLGPAFAAAASAGHGGLRGASSDCTGTLAPLAYAPAPVGLVEPQGWIRQQLIAQRDGIGGRWLGHGARVNNSAWIGGSGSGACVWRCAQRISIKL